MTTAATWWAPALGVALGALGLSCDGGQKKPGPPSAAASAAPAASAGGVAGAPPSAAVSATPTASASAAPPPPAKPLPPELHGFVAFAVQAGADDELRLAELGAAGLGSSALVAKKKAEEVVAGMASRDGATLLYVVSVTENDEPRQRVRAVKRDGSDDRELATCQRTCELVGFDARGVLWYLDRGSGDFPRIMQLHPGQAKPKAWAEGWSACNAQHVALSPDGKQVLVAIDDSFGWPSCIESKWQGVYVRPVDQAQLEGPPLLPFSKKKSSKGMNLNFQIARFSADGARLELLPGGYAETKDDGTSTTDESIPWSSKLDGSDAKQEKLPGRWTLALEDDPGKQRLVAKPPEGDRAVPVVLVGPAIRWASLARRP